MLENIVSNIKHLLTKYSFVDNSIRKVYCFFPVVFRKYLSQKTEVNISDLERKYGFIFTHVPKCAGNGLLRSLFGIGGMGHTEIRQIKKIYLSEYCSYKKIAVVREPFDRFCSAFYYLKAGGMGHYDAEFSDKYIKRYEDVNAFVDAIKKNIILRFMVMHWTHFKPQVNFVTVDGEVVIDMLVKFEELQSSYGNIVNFLGVTALNELTKSNVTISKSGDLSESSKEYIYELYRKDFEMLGYEKN